MYDIDDFLQRASTELSEYESHERRFEELLKENEGRLIDLRQRREAVWLELGSLVLPPGVEEAGLGAVADRFRVPGLTTLGGQIETRRRAIDARVAEIEALSAYRERESRRPRIEHQLDEEGPVFEFARQALEKMEALPGMRELVEKGWDTPRYPHDGWLRYFNSEFLNDWRRADDIVATLEVPDFAAAAAQYAERAEQATVMGQTIHRLRAELAEMEALENERAALLAEREALPQTLRARVGKTLAQMLETRGRDAVQYFPVPDDALRVFAAVEGVEHQIRYLEETSGRIRGDLAQLLDRSGRLREEARRYENGRHRYRNKRFTEEQFGKRFGRSGRYARLHDRYGRTSRTVYGFQDYGRGATYEDFLWWDVMTDGRLDGDFIPEVAEWRERHPAASSASAGGRDPDSAADASSWSLRDDS